MLVGLPVCFCYCWENRIEFIFHRNIYFLAHTHTHTQVNKKLSIKVRKWIVCIPLIAMHLNVQNSIESENNIDTLKNGLLWSEWMQWWCHVWTPWPKILIKISGLLCWRFTLVEHGNRIKFNNRPTLAFCCTLQFVTHSRKKHHHTQ